MGSGAELDIYELLGIFRHDLLNDLQLALGHLQIGYPAAVIEQDLNKMIERIRGVSDLFHSGDDVLAAHVWGWQEVARGRGLQFSARLCDRRKPLPPTALRSLHDLISDLIASLVEEDGPVFISLWMGCAAEISIEFTPPIRQSFDCPAGGAWELHKEEGHWRISCR